MKRSSSGFTIIEIIIIITVIGILSTIGVVSYINIQQTTRDRKRTSNITIIAEALEKYFDQNGQYPDCSELASLNNAKSTLPDVNDDTFKTPKGSGFSLTCDFSPSADNDVLYYEYKGTVGWALRYYRETTKANEIGAKNRRVTTTISFNNNDFILKLITTPGGNVNIEDTYANGSTATIVATADTGYAFDKWVGNNGCEGAANHQLIINQNIECTAYFTINKPAMTNVTASTVGASTTWSWSGVACPAGTSAEYQYYFLTSSGYFEDYGSAQGSLYNLPTTTSYQRTTNSEGATYTLSVKVRCVDNTNSTNVSEWSDPKSASYTRPVASFTLSLIAGTGGSASGGGSFASGSTPTITATAGAGYKFSGWSGNDGCLGVASHTILLNENKTCTATFTVNNPIKPVIALSHDGNLTTYSWQDSCPSGSVEQFQYLFQSEYYDNNYSSPITFGNKPISGTGPGWYYYGTNYSAQYNTSYQGFSHAIYLQGRCKILGQDSYSEWSVTGEGRFSRPVSAPVGPPIWGIYVLASSKYRVHLTANLSNACPEYNTLYTRDDVSSLTWPWKGTSNYGWWNAYHDQVWINNNFSNFGNPLDQASDRYSGDSLANQGNNAKYKLAVQYKCINAYSGRESNPSPVYISGELITGAYQ